MKEKTIPVSRSPFLIGRDSQCHVRAASLAISNRHCSVATRGTRVFIRDFDSTNGTRVNDELLVGEAELHDRDRITVGPLLFMIRIERSVAVDRPTPLPPTKRGNAPVQEEDAAALLLSLSGDDHPVPGLDIDEDGIPTGDTRVEPILPQLDPAKTVEMQAAGAPKTPPKLPQDTSHAAQQILQKYLRRPRS
jgi:pSer/pThr/pTyr-binding forkhead associated (FHA) protein